MARVQYGSIVTQLKGSVAGHVFQPGNVGYVLRTKGYTPGNGIGARKAQNLILSQVTKLWRTLSSAEITAWLNAAALWPFTDKFGNTYYGSGFQVFVAYNTALIVMEEDPVLTPAAPVAPGTPGIVSFSSHTTAALDFTNSIATVGADNLLLFASRPLSAGVGSQHVKFRLMDVFDYSGTGAQSFRAEYLAAFGQYLAGQRIFIKTVCRNTLYPLAAFEQISSAVIT